MYQFDKIIDRTNTNSVKHDLLKSKFGDENLIPLWVADMDFKAPPCIVDAIKNRAEHEIYGYTYRSDSFYKAVIH